MKKIREFRNAIGYIVLFLLLQTLCSYAVTTVAGLRYSGLHPAGDVQQYLDQFISRYTTVILALSQVLTLIVLWLLARRRGLSLGGLVEGCAEINGSIIRHVVLAGFFGNLFTSLFLELLPFSEKMMESYSEASGALDTSVVAANLLSVVLLAPIVEEVIFRGLAFSRFRRITTPLIAVVMQGLVFGVIHGTVIWAIYASVMGILLGWVRWKTGSIKASILMHMAFNAASFVVPVLVYVLSGQRVVYGVAVAVAFGLFVCALLPIGRLHPQDETEENEELDF